MECLGGEEEEAERAETGERGGKEEEAIVGVAA